MEYQCGQLTVITDNSESPSRKMGEIITFDGSPSKSMTEMEIHDYYGVTVYNPEKTMPCGGYARTKYAQLPQRLVDFTKEYLKTDLVDVLASNTNSLILILKTPADIPTVLAKDKPVADSEFMVLERYGACQSNGDIHWRNQPISPWFADRQHETSEFLLNRKFANLAHVSELFDLVVEMLNRRDYSLQDLKDAHQESITMLDYNSLYPGLNLAISQDHTATKNSDIVSETIDNVKRMRADYKLNATAQFDYQLRFTTREPEFVRDITKPHFGQPYITAYYAVD